MKPLYLVDFSNFAYKFKAVHTYAKYDIKGVPVDLSVLVGFIRSLKQNMFNDIVIVLDGKPVNSLNLIPAYKGQRNKNSSDTVGVSKLETIKFLTKIGQRINKNVWVCCAPCQEADQAISSIVHLVTNNEPPRAGMINTINSKSIDEDPWLCKLNNGLQVEDFKWKDYNTVVVGTTDSDMKALSIFDNVFIDTSTSGKAIKSEDTAKAVMGVNAYAIPIYKSIYGDVSDNVPGYNLPKELISILDDTITSREEQNSFIQHVERQTLSNSQWKVFHKILEIDGGVKFKTNLEVVQLRYYSNPIILSYSDYDINTTINKYMLKL